MNIPARFQADCHFCQQEIDIRREGVHQFVSGWVKNRAGGGGNAIAVPERLNRYACKLCIERLKHGTTIQMTLFR